MKSNLSTFWVLALAFGVMVTGCGGDDEVVVESGGTVVTTTDDGQSFSMDVKGEDGKTATMKVSGDDQSFTIEGENGLSMQVGENAKIPADFPSDVPVYKGLALNMSHASEEGYMIQGTVGDEMEAVSAFYKAEAAKQGWTEESSFSQAGDAPMSMLSFKKDERTLTVSVSREDDKTSAQIMAGK